MPPIDTTYYPDGTALHLWQVTEDITALMECCKNLGITPPNTMNCTKRMKEKLIEVLKGLGYKQPDIKRILPQIDRTLELEEQIKEALRLMLK